MYLEEQKVAADNLQGQLESHPDYQAEIADLRSRILGRWTTVQENSEATRLHSPNLALLAGPDDRSSSH